MNLKVSLPAPYDRGPEFVELFYRNIHACITSTGWSVGYGTDQGQTAFMITCPSSAESLVRQQLAAQYPNAKIERTNSDRGQVDRQMLRLVLMPDIFPLRPHPEFTRATDREFVDPSAGMLSTLARYEELNPMVCCSIQPASARQRLRLERTLWWLQRRQFQLIPLVRQRVIGWLSAPARTRQILAWMIGFLLPKQQQSSRLELETAASKLQRHFFSVECTISISSDTGLSQHQSSRRLQELAASLGPFTVDGQSTFVQSSTKRSRPFVLSDLELATMFHPATQLVRVPKSAHATHRRLEPPLSLPAAKDAFAVALAQTDFPGRKDVFGLADIDRLQHVYVVGATGQGKSSLLQRMIVDDMRKGKGVCVFDPHGELATDITNAVPSRRKKDLVRFEPGTNECLQFNPLATEPGASLQAKERHVNLLLSGLMKIFGFDLGSAPRMQYVLRNALRALTEFPNATLLDLMRLLRDGGFRRQVIDRVTNAEVRHFWIEEFEARGRHAQNEWVAPVQNKIGTITTSVLMRQVFGAEKSSFNLREIMDSGKIMVVNLDKGRLTEETSRIFGILLMSYLQAEVLSRSELPTSQRRPFYLYVDEFQNYISDTFESMLSESRKYALGITIAHQYLSQLDDAESGISLRGPVFGNVGSMISFRVGQDDAAFLADAMGNDITTDDIAGLPRFHAFARLTNRGVVENPFSIKLLPPNKRNSFFRRPLK